MEGQGKQAKRQLQEETAQQGLKQILTTPAKNQLSGASKASKLQKTAPRV